MASSVTDPSAGQATSPPSPSFTRRDAWLFALCLLPVAGLPWCFRYWPGEDSLNHLAIAHIMTQLLGQGSPFANYLRASFTLKPYTLHYDLLIALGQVMPLRIADKLVVSAVAAGMPIVTLWALLRIAPHRWANVYLALPMWALPRFLIEGMINFALGLVLAIAVFPLLYGPPGSGPASRRRVIGAACCFLLAMLAHPFACLLGAAGLVAMEWSSSRMQGEVGVRRWLRLATVIAPGALCAIASVIVNHIHRAELAPMPPICEGRPWAFYCEGLLWMSPIIGAMKELVVWSQAEFPFRALSAVGLFACAGLGVAARVRDRRLVALVVAAAWVVALLPWGAKGRVGFMPERAYLFLQFAMVLVAAPPRWLVRFLMPLSLVVTVSLVSIEYRAARDNSRVLDDIRALGSSIPRGATAAYAFDPERLVGIGVPLQFAWGVLTVERDVTSPDLFADGLTTKFGGTGYRPLKYLDHVLPHDPGDCPYPELREYLRHFDYYVVTDGSPERLAQLTADFGAPQHTDRVAIFHTRGATQSP